MVRGRSGRAESLARRRPILAPLSREQRSEWKWIKVDLGNKKRRCSEYRPIPENVAKQAGFPPGLETGSRICDVRRVSHSFVLQLDIVTPGAVINSFLLWLIILGVFFHAQQ
jgi:hypothetical protein